MASGSFVDIMELLLGSVVGATVGYSRGSSGRVAGCFGVGSI